MWPIGSAYRLATKWPRFLHADAQGGIKPIFHRRVPYIDRSGFPRPNELNPIGRWGLPYIGVPVR